MTLNLFIRKLSTFGNTVLGTSLYNSKLIQGVSSGYLPQWRLLSPEVKNKFNQPQFSTRSIANLTTPLLTGSKLLTQSGISWDKFLQSRSINFVRIHEKGIVVKRKSKKNPLGGKPYAKGVVLKTFVKKPRKPNSANRKCVLLRLSTGREMTAYVPGEGHNLQEHNMVLVRVGRLRDVPGVKLKCVRGAYDLTHVVKKKA